MPTIKRSNPSWYRTMCVLVSLVLFGGAGFPHEEESEEERSLALSTVSAVEGFTSCGTNPRWPLPYYDYSRAGYRENTVAVPYRQRTATRSYGPGRHRITRLLQLRSGQVLRGAGRDRTVLYFPVGLKGLGVPCDGNPVDCWDWGRGVVRATGSETGIEDLTIEFPAHSWTHHGGASVNGGYNGISLDSCINCWVKNVTVRNADNGLMIRGGANNTIDGLHVYGNPDGAHIHVAMSAGAQDNLVTNFRVYGRTSHGLVFNWGATGGVFANGWGDKVVVESDHSCGGGGGTSPCTENALYSNISGKIRKIRRTDRLGRPLLPDLWNVGVVDRCPLDAFLAQLR